MANDRMRWRAMQFGAWYASLSSWPGQLAAGGILIAAGVAFLLIANATGDIGAAVLFAPMMAALVFYAGLSSTLPRSGCSKHGAA